jgi:glycolate oxidase FAD binding subunit
MASGGGPPAAGGDAALDRIVEQVRAAAEDGCELRIRGGGSKDFYGGALRGAVLDVSSLSGISRYEPTEMVITARAATPLGEIEAAIAERGQYLGFEPPRFDGVATLGGAVASGLNGPARLACGSARDFVLGAVLLDGRGQLLRFGGQVMKNVAGYDVSRLLAGSLGVLGVVCEVSLKVMPRPPASATLWADCPQAQAVERVRRWMAQALPVHASVWQEGRLHVRLSGARSAVESASRLLAQESGARVLDPPQAAAFWDALRDQTCSFFSEARDALQPQNGTPSLALWRISVPPAHPPLELPGKTLVEWGGSQRWLLTDADGAEVRRRAALAGGHALIYRSGTRPSDFLAEIPDKLKQLHQTIKQSFDPKGLFNRGRLYSWL